MTEPAVTAEEIVALLRGAEPWLDKRGLARHFACSVRSIETALGEGLPHAVIFGRCKFRVSEVEPWLAEHGYLERYGKDAARTSARTSARPPQTQA